MGGWGRNGWEGKGREERVKKGEGERRDEKGKRGGKGGEGGPKVNVGRSRVRLLPMVRSSRK